MSNIQIQRGNTSAISDFNKRRVKLKDAGLTRFLLRCASLGLRKGLLAGLLLPVGTALFTLIFSTIAPDSGIPDLVRFVGENLVVAVYTILFSLPLGALIGLFLGVLFGLISYGLFIAISKPASRMVLDVCGLGLATAAALFVVWSINFALSLWALDIPDVANQFSVPGALLTFFFAYTSRFRVEKWHSSYNQEVVQFKQ